MKRVVVDASVVVKWLFPDRNEESNAVEALLLLESVRRSDVEVRQPPHWLAEVAGVTTRLSPKTAKRDVDDLCAMEFEIVDSRVVYLKACKLSIELSHHLFDTLYHAVALSLHEATFITADERYYRKAEAYGNILLLKDLKRDMWE